MTNKRKNELKFKAAVLVTSLAENLSLGLSDENATDEEIDFALKVLSSIVSDRAHNKAVAIVKDSYKKIEGK